MYKATHTYMCKHSQHSFLIKKWQVEHSYASNNSVLCVYVYVCLCICLCIHMIQTQIDLPFPKSIVLPEIFSDVSLQVPSYHFPLYHLPSLIPFIYTHTPNAMKFFLLTPHGFPLPGLYIHCFLHVEFSGPSSLPGVLLFILQVPA